VAQEADQVLIGKQLTELHCPWDFLQCWACHIPELPTRVATDPVCQLKCS
jgi:hypothetical protein